MENQKVSIIIPVYNGGRWIEDCINSVMNQTHTNIEIVVVDDCSTDDSVQKVETIDDSRITVLKNDSNLGIAASRNRGIRHCSGQFVGFLDQDDRWLEHKLETQLRHFLIAPEKTGVIYSAVELQDTNEETTVVDSSPTLSDDYQDRVREIFLNNPVTNISALIRKECFEKCGLLDENLFGSDDYEFWLRIAGEYGFEYIDDSLAQKRIHGENASANLDQMVADRLRIAEHYVNEYPFLRDHYSQRLAFIRIDAARRAFANAQYYQGLRYWLRSLFYTPREGLKLSLRGGRYLTSEILKNCLVSNLL